MLSDAESAVIGVAAAILGGVAAQTISAWNTQKLAKIADRSLRDAEERAEERVLKSEERLGAKARYSESKQVLADFLRALQRRYSLIYDYDKSTSPPLPDDSELVSWLPLVKLFAPPVSLAADSAYGHLLRYEWVKQQAERTSQMERRHEEFNAHRDALIDEIAKFLGLPETGLHEIASLPPSLGPED